MRINSVNTDAGLELLIHPEAEHYRSFTEPIYGFFMYIHHRDDFVDSPTDWFTFQQSYHVKILIRPDVIHSSEKVRSLTINQRECIFQEENPLEFIKKYSFLSCLSECRVREIIRFCQCIPFHFHKKSIPMNFSHQLQRLISPIFSFSKIFSLQTMQFPSRELHEKISCNVQEFEAIQTFRAF